MFLQKSQICNRRAETQEKSTSECDSHLQTVTDTGQRQERTLECTDMPKLPSQRDVRSPLPLSIWQPWGACFLKAQKPLETRKWLCFAIQTKMPCIQEFLLAIAFIRTSIVSEFSSGRLIPSLVARGPLYFCFY